MAWLTITHCARANWTNDQWLVKRTEQHSTSRRTKEMLSRNQTSLNKTQQGWTRLNKVVKRSEHFVLNKCSVCSMKCWVRLTVAFVFVTARHRLHNFPRREFLFVVVRFFERQKFNRAWANPLQMFTSSIDAEIKNDARSNRTYSYLVQLAHEPRWAHTKLCSILYKTLRFYQWSSCQFWTSLS